MTILLVVLCVLIITGLPVGFALMIGSTAAMIALDLNLLSIPITLFSGSSSFVLLAIPLFIVMGELMSVTSIAERLIDLARALVGWIRGGLAHMNIVASMFMAEMSGSAVADAAAMSKIFVPQMDRAGYPRPYAAAVTSASAIIGIIIPPSIPLVIFGAITNTSVRDLFIAGAVPGVLLGFIFMVISYIFAKLHDHPVDQAFRLRPAGVALRRAAVPLMVPIVVVGGLIGGVFTPTEAAAIGVVITLAFGFAMRELKGTAIYRVLVQSAEQTASVMLIVAGAALLSQVLANQQVPQTAAMLILQFAETPTTFLLFVNALLLVVGLFLQPSAAIILVVPILMPIASQMGVDPVQFGVIVCVNLAIGQQTPPVANVLLTVCGVTGVKMQHTLPYLVWFILGMLILLAGVSYIPWLTLWFM
jgi:C4-dicarboxylate transporter DctM subunit